MSIICKNKFARACALSVLIAPQLKRIRYIMLLAGFPNSERCAFYYGTLLQLLLDVIQRQRQRQLLIQYL